MDIERHRTDPGEAAEGADACGQVRSAEQSTPHKPSTSGVAPADVGPALVAAAELMCTAVSTPIHAPAADVVVHVDADTLAQTAHTTSTDTVVPEARIDDGPPLPHAVLQMLACHGRIQLSVHATDGRTLDLGRKRRRPHRALHDGHFAITALGRQKFRCHGPHGAERPAAPKTRANLADLTRNHPHITPTTIEPHWDGTPLDLPHATDLYLAGWAHKATRAGATQTAN